jgi:hypothetical protein
MSLKAFHVLFIAISILLAFGFAAWSFRQFSLGGAWLDLVVGIISAVTGLGLIVYGRYFLKKLKHISYL